MKANKDFLYSVDRIWSDARFIGLEGWAFSKSGKLSSLEVQVGSESVYVDQWFPRPDVESHFSEYSQHNKDCGFRVVIPRVRSEDIRFLAKRGDVGYSADIAFSQQALTSPFESKTASRLWSEFIEHTNSGEKNVLEIGSRLVSPGSPSKREKFPVARSYTGFDYYDDENTDVVGDAHKLSQYFTQKKFEAVFSLSVFEHLAMPWVVAAEISKLMPLGATTFHATHFSFPLHEAPWDFWRFSDEGLKALFSPALGFEVLGCGLFNPVSLHPRDQIPGQEMLPLSPGFASVAIWAKKVSEPDFNRFVWDTTTSEVLGAESHYPKAD
jgi:hypothetical protein